MLRAVPPCLLARLLGEARMAGLGGVKSLVKVYGRRGVEYEAEPRSWVRNFRTMLYGFLNNVVASPITKPDGGGDDIRTSGQFVRGKVQIRLGIGSTSPSYTDYYLESYKASLDTYVSFGAITGGYRIRIYGTYSPSEAVTIYELVLLQPICEGGGGSIECIWLREVFPDGVAHGAGESKTYEVTLDILV